MSNDGPITAPGRTALWTEAALRALTGAATALHDSACGIFVDEDMIQHRARAIATAFEAACLKQHAAKRAEREAQLAEDTETVLRTRRYRILWAGVPHVLTVARVEGSTVYFVAVADVANGAELRADIDDVVGGMGFEAVGPEEQA